MNPATGHTKKKLRCMQLTREDNLSKRDIQEILETSMILQVDLTEENQEKVSLVMVPNHQLIEDANLLLSLKNSTN
jgi:hypothetical protein